MKYPIHYQVEYKLAPGGGILRGEIGAMTYTRNFSGDELNEAIQFVNQFECYNGENIYNRSGKKLNKSDVKEGESYHIQSPKIWHMNFRCDWRSFQQREKMFNKKPKWSDWAHIEGDSYVVKAEFFNLKERRMEYSCSDYQTLEAAFKSIKFKDTKTRLLSDWTIYSKHQFIS